MKIYFRKRKPRIITYQKYKNFRYETSLTSLQYEVDKKKAFLYENGLGTFSNICTDVLEKHAPRKKRYLRVNRKPFINPEISKAIMTRTRLRNCVLKKRNKNRVIL